jgi:hypothetical protein
MLLGVPSAHHPLSNRHAGRGTAAELLCKLICQVLQADDACRHGFPILANAQVGLVQDLILQQINAHGSPQIDPHVEPRHAAPAAMVTAGL